MTTVTASTRAKNPQNRTEWLVLRFERHDTPATLLRLWASPRRSVGSFSVNRIPHAPCHAKVIKGEMSAHAAMVTAGFRKMNRATAHGNSLSPRKT
ncbi:MAG: hypothetical protein IT381_14000 [Deltaproteobacteria bacterium]|nr:hypothetical protein [Deltaproteobacteria bacterium]